MAVFTKNIKLEFLSAADKIEKWAEPINDNLIKIDALGTEIVAAMLPFASLREAIEKNAGTNVDSTSIFFPDNISLPDVGDGVKRKLTDVISQIANNKMSVDNPAVRTGTMKLLSGSSSMPALSFGTSYDAYISGGNLIFAKGNVAQMTLVDKGIQVPETNEFNGESVVNVSFLKSKGLQAAWAGAGLKYTGAPTQYLEVIGNKLKAIKVDATNGVEMTWDDLVRTSVIKLSDFMIIQDPATKEFKATTKKEFLGQLLVKNYGAKFDPTTGSVIGDPLNSVLNPAGPSVPDGESPGNVSYVLSKNGNFDGKNVYAGQQVYWDTNTSKWTMTAEYVRLTSFTGADGVTITGDMVAGYGQYNAGLIRLDTSGMDTVAAASTSVQAGIKDLDSKKFNKTGGTISGDITVDDINVTAGHIVTIPTVPVNDHDAINKIYADAKFALLLGDKNNVFRVATPVGDDDAIPKKYVESLVAGTVSAYYTKVETDNKYALKAGNLSQVFSVAAPTNDEHAVNKKFTEDTYAKKQGDNTLVFQAANPVSPNDVVNKQYLEENVVSGQSAGKALKFTAGSPGVAPKIDVDIVDKMGLGFDVADENGKLMIDYPNLDRTLQVKPGDYIMVYDEVSGQILKVKKDDFLGTLTQSLRLRGSWNPNTNVILGDPLNPQVVGGSVTINTFSKTLAYAKDDFVFYAPFQPTWVLSNAYTKGDRVTKDGLDYVANDDIPANTDFAEGTTGATWQFIDLYETYRAQEAIAPGPFDPSKWKKVAYSGSGPVGLAGDNTSGFAYSVQADGQFDLNATGTSTPMLAGDEIVWTGSAWILVPDAQAVKQVFGRTGPVIAAPGDYKADQITYTRATGKTDISGQTTDVQIAINELDDKKVSRTKDQTISGNKTFSGNTVFQVQPKVPSKPLTPADDDLITKAYVAKLLTDNDYVTRTYTTVAGKPVTWQLAQSNITMTGQILNAAAESEVYVDGISKLVVKGNSGLLVEDNSKLILGSATTLDTDVTLQHFKGKFDLQSTASMHAQGKINILYTPTDDDDAVPKKWVEDKILAAQTGYTKAEADAKFYLLTGGDVNGWGQFKQTETQSWALRLKSTSGVDGIFMSTTAADVSTISNGLSKPIIQTTASYVKIASVGRPIYFDAHCEATYGARLKNTQLFSTMGTLQVAGDQQMAFTNKIIGGKLHAGLWGHSLANPHNKTSADLVEDDSFLLNSDTWTLRGNRFEINTVQGAHCAVVPTEDTHLVNKKFLDGKMILDVGPADNKNYVRKNQAWSELVIPAPSYWTLPDLPQQLKDIVLDSTSAANDSGAQKFYKQVSLFAKGAGSSGLKFYSGDRVADGNELFEFRAHDATTGEIRSSKGFKLSQGAGGSGNLDIIQFNTSSQLRLISYGHLELELGGVGAKNIIINKNSEDLVGQRNTHIMLKGANGGTDVRLFKLLASDAASGQLTFDPGYTRMDGSVSKQIQLIPNSDTNSAFYHDAGTTRWTFRKLPRMATDALNVTPTQPEEFITKKHLDSVTATLGVAAGQEGQVYTMGATAWAGKFPQYMGSVTEASAKNKIKIDDDTAGGKILIQATSVGASDANIGKNIEMFIDGNGQETQFTSNNINIWNESRFGNITLSAQGASQDLLLSGANTITQQASQVRLYSNSASLPIMIRQNAVQFGQTLSIESVRMDYSTNTVTGLSQITHKLEFAGTSTNGNLWKQLGSPACNWDELRVIGISSVDGGINITSTASADWSNASTPEQTRRSNRSGPIWIMLKKLPYDNASPGTSNAVNLTAETTFGAVNASALGASGKINLQAGPLDFNGILHNTPVNWNQQINFASGGSFNFRAAGWFSVEANGGLSMLAGTGASSRNGFAISRTLDAAQCYNGIAPTSGGNIFISPNVHGGYNGNNVQIGAPNAAGTRFAGLFVRGLDVGEGGSLSTTNSVTGRGIALVGSTPKWAAAQSASLSDNYPRGGILIGVRGDGAETNSDSRHVQIINESKFGRIDVLAVPNAGSVKDSIINILQGSGLTASTVNGIYLKSATNVELSGVKVEVKAIGQATSNIVATSTGTVIFNYTAASDKRIKKNIADIKYGLVDILKLRAVQFNRTDVVNSKTELGFIAQEVAEIMPEVVSVAEDEMKTLSLSYDKMVAPLVKAIQDQQAIIEKLLQRVSELEKGA